MTINAELAVRHLQEADLQAVVDLDARLTGTNKESYWQHALVSHERDGTCVGLAASVGDELEGYLFGEVRTIEFGSERCGWILALGVQPSTARQGVASALLAEARLRFLELGVKRVRTMVKRTDVPMLALFRSQSFVGGPFVQLELDIEGNLVSEEQQ